MTTALYAPGKAAILRGDLDVSGGDIRVLPVTAAYTPNMTAHANLEDVAGGARAAAAVALTSKVITTAIGLAIFDADDVTFPSVASGDDIVGLVMYLHTGNEATATLLGYFDYFSNLPLTPDGRDVVATWPDTTNRIFSM